MGAFIGVEDEVPVFISQQYTVGNRRCSVRVIPAAGRRVVGRIGDGDLREWRDGDRVAPADYGLLVGVQGLLLVLDDDNSVSAH